MKEIKIQKNSGEYDFKGNFTFKSEKNSEEIVKISAENALEIAYTLFDWAGLDYTVLEDIYIKINQNHIPYI